MRLSGILIAALVLSACDGEAPAPAPGQSRDAVPPAAPAARISACTLLTSDEVRAIIGTEAPGKETADAGFEAACSWEAASATGQSREVSVEVGRLDEGSIKGEYDTFKQTMSARADVSGIGDEAFLAGYSAAGSALVIRRQTLLIFINTTVPEKEEVLKQVGPQVVARAAGRN